MHLKFFIGIGLILFGSVSLGQGRYADQEDDSDEMDFNERELDRAARREERLEALSKLFNFQRRGTGEKYCVEIRNNLNTYGMQKIDGYWGVPRESAQACMADCNKLADCVQWTYHDDCNDEKLYKTCYLKSTKGTEGAQTDVESGSCDNTQHYILGIGTDQKLWTRANLESNWVQVPNTDGAVIGVIVLKDGSILGIGTDRKLWTRATLNSNWVRVPNTDGEVTAITQLQDGTILGVGMDKKLWTRANLQSNWVQVPNTNGAVIGITVLKDGTILGIGTDQKLWTRANLQSNWVQVPNTHGAVIGISATPN